MLMLSLAGARRASSRVPKLSMLTSAEASAVAAAAAARLSEPLVMPPRLSPTAAATFRDCPQLYLFRNLWRLPEPPSKVLEKGSLVHAALEKVFEAPPEERAGRLHDVLRDEWRKKRREAPKSGTAPSLVEALFASVEEEREWGLECLRLLDNWLAAEDPAAMPHGEPLAHEAWMRAQLPTEPASGLPALELVGKVDRLDGLPGGGVAIVDYKTGKAPRAYSAATDAQIRRRSFFQLRCYALLLARGGLRASPHWEGLELRARRLRLLYLGGGSAGVDVVEELPHPDSGEYEAELAQTEAELVALWGEIASLVRRGDPRAFEPCSRKFCSCHELRPIVFKESRSQRPA